MGINNGGIFSLGDVSVLQQQGNWSEGNWVQDENRVLRDRYGYFAGGWSNGGGGGFLGPIDRIDFSSSTTEVVTKGSVLVKVEEFAATGNVNYGYMGGGDGAAAGEYYSAIWRLDYSNDNQDTLRRSKLPIIKYALAATGNKDYGYFGGGKTYPGGTPGSQVYRLDYSNDESDASPKSILSTPSGHYYAAATGNKDYGYWGGGEIPSISIDDVSRLDYANDGVDAVPKGSIGAARYNLAATSNANYGYFGGGYGGPGAPNKHESRVFRLDYSNDETNAIIKGNLYKKREKLSATGNHDYGYFGGGVDATPNPDVYYSLIDRIDYANDTSTAEVKGNLVIDRSQGIAVSSAENVLPKQYDTVPDISDTNIQPVGTDYGYFVGGGSGMTSIVDRLDYSNDTAPTMPRGTLSDDRNYMASVGSHFYGYTAGGGFPGSPTIYFSSLIDRLDFYNDTVTALKKSFLINRTAELAAVGNENYGYFGGGWLEVPGGFPPTSNDLFYSTISRIDYSNDTLNAASKGYLNAPLKSGRKGLTATGNQSYGYFAAGENPLNTSDTHYSTVDRVDYSNDTATALIRGNLTAKRKYLSATGNANFGYFGGGNTPSNSSGMDVIDRIDYSNDNTIAAVGPLADARYLQSATGNSNAGYFAGGSPGPVDTIYCVDYSNDGVEAPAKSQLSTSRGAMGAMSSRANGLPTTRIAERVGLLLDPYTFGKVKYTVSNYGFFGGGYAPGSPNDIPHSTVDRIDFSNDTVGARFSTTLTQARTYLAATGNSSYGYFSTGEQVNHNPSLSNTDRLDYSNDYIHSVPSLTGIFSVGYSGATGNQNYGYWAGGKHSNYYSYIKRLDYSNDTVTPRGFLSLIGPVPTTGRSNLAAAGNKDYGYFAGGEAQNLSENSAVSRIDYSNDNTIALTRGPLSKVVIGAAAAGDENYGYFSGGYNGTSVLASVDRIDYANDTADAVPKGPLTSTRYYHSGTSGIDCGYWGGGSPAPSYHSDIYRTAFSNDTATSIPKGTLSGPRTYLAAVSARINGFSLISDYPKGKLGTSNYGYFGGGGYHNLPILSTIDRIDYSNDTTRSIEKGMLTHFRWGLSAVGNSYYGYFGGGTDAANYPGGSSYVDRIDYSNDGVQASPRGHLGASRRNWAAVGNNNVAYWSGGYSSPSDNPNTFEDTYRIVYANDLVTYSTAIPSTLINERQGVATAGNQNYAYYAGGYKLNGSGTDYLSRIQRFDYSDDTANTVLKGTLQSYPGGATMIAGTGNKDYGYFGGGSDSSGQVSFIDRLDYSNDSTNAIFKGNLSANKSAMGATGNPNSGYFGGGGSPSAPSIYSAVDRLDYSNDTSVVSKGPLTVSRMYLGATSARESDLPIIGLTSEQFINPGNNTQKGASAYGWFAGGIDDSPARISTLDRIDYTNDTANAVIKGSLNANKEGLGSVGNLNYGYFGGGQTPGGMSDTIDRIDYSNNSLSTISATLTLARWGLSAVGNANYGYFAGGRTPGSPDVFHTTVDRIDYSNDTVRSPFQGPLNDLEAGHTASVGNQNYGYFAGGFLPATNWTSLVNRIDYSNDTAIAVSKGTLGFNRAYMAATGNANYGYFGGGFTSNGLTYNFSDIFRIEYANDITNATPKGTLTSKKYAVAATGNLNYGWFGGGKTLGPPGSPFSRNQIDRIDYSNDTTASPTQRSLSTYVNNLSGSSAAANGLPQ